MSGWTVADIMGRLPPPPCEPLPVPLYFGLPHETRPRVMLGVEEMARHTSDEGAQLQWGLGYAGYLLTGYNFRRNETDVMAVIDDDDPGVVVVQDVREWQGRTAARRGITAASFRNTEYLRVNSDIFTLTVIKDAQNDPAYHADWSARMGVHAWITYYHPDIVCRLASHVRRQHMIRTVHTVDAAKVPPYTPRSRRGVILSGALSQAYPLRVRLARNVGLLPQTNLLGHPGYHARGAATPSYLRTLSRHKVAVCTASRYGYTLRRIIEATACGCAVLTDLPCDDVMDRIDGNLVRVHNDATSLEVAVVLERMLRDYDPERQAEFASLACEHYDYKAAGLRLAADIESMRRRYPA
jgi:hypothetical protein